MTDSPAAQAEQTQSGEQAFPPEGLEAFLRFCAGEWMTLRSQLQLGIAAEGDDEGWHSSERGELVIAYIEGDGPGGLSLTPKLDGVLQSATRLDFAADGRFSSHTGSAGTWTLWPDGSLELVLEAGGTEVREKIWFTKPNLRLRSTIENRADGSPGRASFSSEIRRVSRPA